MKFNFINRKNVFFVLISMSSYIMADVQVGDQVSEAAECTAAGLGHELNATPTQGEVGLDDFFQFTCTAQDLNQGRGGFTSSQIIRNHSASTFEHILSSAPYMFGMEKVTNSNKMAASSDNNTGLSFWGNSNLTQISEEQGSHFDTDIYQFTAGFDKVIGNFFVGSSLTYAHTEDEQGTTTSTSETVGFTPYIAYKINDYLFASGLAGYLYSHTNRVDGGSDQDTHDYLSEVNMNAFKVINSFILKGRMGVRYKHTITSVDNGGARDNSFDELTWVGDGEIGYKFNKLHIYTGLLYEYYDREESGASIRVRDSIAFMRYGVDYPVNNTLTLGAKIQHDLNDEDNDYITGSINARLAF